jgi:hypothetical protein
MDRGFLRHRGLLIAYLQSQRGRVALLAALLLGRLPSHTQLLATSEEMRRLWSSDDEAAHLQGTTRIQTQ